MAILYGNSLNLGKNELQNARIQNLASDPSSPVVGQTYFNTGTNKLRTYNGSTWDEYGTSTATGDVSQASASSGAGLLKVSAGASKVITDYTSTGLVKTTSGVASAAVSGTDYSAGTAALATGILKSTTTTGALSIAVAGDFPTLNQNTTGSAATLTTSRNIYGNAFNGSADITAVIAATYGGTNNAFFQVSGPASTIKTYTFPNANSTMVSTDSTATLTNKTIDANGTGNSITNLEVADFAGAAIVTAAEGIAANNNDTTLPTSAAVKAYTDALIGANDAMVYKGAIDASSNPNYPAATNAGETWKISVAGKIGGASGPDVKAGDMIIATADGLSSGNHATVGASWNIIQYNLDSATDTVQGVVELATVSETEAKTDTGRAVTPAGLVSFTRKYTGLIGDGSTTAIAVTHGLGSQYVTAQVFDATTGAMIIVDTTLTSSTQTTFTFAVAPASNAYRVVIVG